MAYDKQEVLSPEFPALIVCDDGSVGGIPCLDYWTGDVDQWFWSDKQDYLIDTLGRKFEQSADRDRSGRPLEIPEWRFVESLDGDGVREIIQSSFPAVDGSIRGMVEAINILERQ